MNNKQKGLIGIVLAVMIIFLVFNLGEKKPKDEFIILATTTSTQDSGLLDYLLPIFQEETGIEARVVAVGTGKALQMGRDGQADVLLVHAKKDEETFVKEGHGLERFDVMYNDFIIVGPTGAQSTETAKSFKEVAKVMAWVNENQQKFVSRGDDSGTHKKEIALWAAGVPTGDFYVSAGKGMGEVLQMANELQAFTLTDRATYLSMKDKLQLEIVTEGDPALLNQYGVIAVNPDKGELIHEVGAQTFIQWILSKETQELIRQFGVEKYGQPLFFPNAQ